MALRTSWMSTLLTISNEFSCAICFLSSNLERLLDAMPLSVSHVRAKSKQPEKAFRGGGGDFFIGNPEQTGQGMGGAGNKGGFVTLAAIGSRCQPWGVGLDQNPIQWDAGGHLAQELGLGIGEIAGEGDQEAEIE